MSRKRFCLVPTMWDVEDCSRHSCHDQSHVHLSRSQLWELEADGLIEWLHRPVNRRDKGIVRLRKLHPVRGVSCRVGEALAEALRQRLPWAALMMADINLEQVR